MLGVEVGAGVGVVVADLGLVVDFGLGCRVCAAEFGLGVGFCVRAS